MKDDLLFNWWTSWHQILDRELGPDPLAKSYKKVASGGFGCDFRMHFDTWQLSDDALRGCFELLPKGDEIADRLLYKDAGTVTLGSSLMKQSTCHQVVRDFSHLEYVDLNMGEEIHYVSGNLLELEAKKAEEALPYDDVSEFAYDRSDKPSGDLRADYYFVNEIDLSIHSRGNYSS